MKNRFILAALTLAMGMTSLNADDIKIGNTTYNIAASGSSINANSLVFSFREKKAETINSSGDTLMPVQRPSLDYNTLGKSSVYEYCETKNIKKGDVDIKLYGGMYEYNTAHYNVENFNKYNKNNPQDYFDARKKTWTESKLTTDRDGALNKPDNRILRVIGKVYNPATIGTGTIKCVVQCAQQGELGIKNYGEVPKDIIFKDILNLTVPTDTTGDALEAIVEDLFSQIEKGTLKGSDITVTKKK